MARVRTDLPCPEAPTKPEDLAAIHVEVEALHDRALAEADLEVAHADDRLRWSASERCAAGLQHGQYLIAAKKHREEPIEHDDHEDCLHDGRVTCRPSDSAEPSTGEPSIVAMMPMTRAMKGALISPTMKVLMPTAARSRDRKTSVLMSP